MTTLSRIRRAIWKTIRIAIPCAALAILLADQTDRVARSALWSLQKINYADTARELHAEARFDEGIAVLRAGIADADSDAARDALIHQLEETIADQHSVVRRAKAVAQGAWTGRGDTPEALVGAIGTDLFVIGDIRDLVIQSRNWAQSEDVDELIVALSTAGLATTVLPQLDGAMGAMKTAAKSGLVRPAFARRAANLFRAQSGKAGLKGARRMLADVSSLRRTTSTGTALRLLRHADDPQDLARMSKYVKESRAGAFALLATGDEGVAALRAGGAQIQWIEHAARRGADGRRWLRSATRMGLRPHPFLGLAKGVYKGNVPKLIPSVLQAFDRACWWFIPALATWLFLEVLTIGQIFRTGKRTTAEPAADVDGTLVAA